MNTQVKDLPVMDYPPLTEDLEEAKEHLDLYLSLIHISSPRDLSTSRMPSSA